MPDRGSVNTAVLQEFLQAALSDDDLNELCFHHFKTASATFAQGMNRRQKELVLIEYALRHAQVDFLLEQVTAINPAQVARFKDRFYSSPDHSGPSMPVEIVDRGAANELDAPNPFTATLAIKDALRFVGREAELRRLHALLQDGSVALLGERKIGKSSLLWQISQTWPGTVLGPFDCMGMEDARDLYDHLAHALALEQADWRTLRRGLRQCQALLLLDELDVGPRIGLTFNDLARLRTVCQENRHFKLVAVSHQPLKRIFPDPGVGSAAYDFLQPLTLPVLREHEARGLLAHPWAPSASLFDGPTSDLILSLTAGHPFNLQRAAYHRYHALSEAAYDWLAAYHQDMEQML
ncbi:hypothetical protein [Candidatus Amarolinea dominans]|uniref:hypothetical protein n=1 Tax=Candidatus Amarolinea dominans TaxID=3140696 RepID=UPI003135DA14|nr:ATP-binding protein [Anaerolineae bacterium]